MKMNELRKVYKLHSKQLKKSKWNLDLPLSVAMSEQPEAIVSLNDSQVLRWIDEINGIDNTTEQIKNIKNQIRREKKQAVTSKTKKRIRELYNQLYAVQFKRDYVLIIMDSTADYDRANKGFVINGIHYRRFLGTNGGVKNSTIVYLNTAIYPEIKHRLDNGRNMAKELIPAKLEAYQALVCSGSTPIPQPKGIIVVNDCITHFTDDVITISDEAAGEPVLRYEKDFMIEHNNSDGCGLMSPEYSRMISGFLNGEPENTISGMNVRYAWTKGMLFTFPFVEFAEKVAGTYEIIDAWGTKRDIRNADVIITVSMLKLWDSYPSWEEYYRNCQENHYQFSVNKITPTHLENVRTTNYQFLQSYQFTDSELKELCQPTVDEITDVLGGDYRKSIVFMSGDSLTAENSVFLDDDPIKALMIEPQMINDPYIKAAIYSNIKKKIQSAKKGTIKTHGNYSVIGGDLYALCQSMFGLEITGLLKAGEIYHKYWIDNGDKQVVCFRSPMSCSNNIRKMNLSYSKEAACWFKYIDTALIYNAFDTACEAMNGQDFDADANMVTNNPVLLSNTKKAPTIICVQRKAEKKIPTEADIIEANKIAFNDDIGTITNRITSMFEVQAGFTADSPEYRELTYRIMCGQLMQQNSVDRVKGIVAKPMPAYWYRLKRDEEYTDLQTAIVASKKPYFMQYVYPQEKTAYDTYIKKSNTNARIKFGVDIAGLEAMENKSDEINEFLYWYRKRMPLGENPCTVNLIANFFESAFSHLKQPNNAEFDYTILKSNAEYTTFQFNKISSIYNDYKIRVADFMQAVKKERPERDEVEIRKQFFRDEFKAQCDVVCPDERIQTDIILDLCYNTNASKAFAWEMCGSQIIKNLLESHNNSMFIPIKKAAFANGESMKQEDFEFNGNRFMMEKIDVKENA